MESFPLPPPAKFPPDHLLSANYYPLTMSLRPAAAHLRGIWFGQRRVGCLSSGVWLCRLSTEIQPQDRPPAEPQTNRKTHGSGQLSRIVFSEPARDNNFTFKHWQLHRSRFRRFRHFRYFLASATLHRLLFPDMLILGGVSGGLVYANEFLLEQPIYLPAFPSSQS